MSSKTTVTVDGEISSLSKLRGSDGEYLPNHVFGYYSGRSDRLERIFDPPQRRYYEAAIKPGAEETVDPRQSELRRLFYVRSATARLLSLPILRLATRKQGTSCASTGVSAFDSALIVLRQTEWEKKAYGRVAQAE